MRNIISHFKKTILDSNVILNEKGLIRPLKNLVRPFKALRRPLEGPLRPLKGLIRPNLQISIKQWFHNNLLDLSKIFPHKTFVFFLQIISQKLSILTCSHSFIKYIGAIALWAPGPLNGLELPQGSSEGLIRLLFPSPLRAL